MDHGKLTDHNGKTVDFRNVILIMTTNAGASDLAQRGDRVRRARPAWASDDDAIKRLFTPEFRNRLDAIIGFAGLTPEIVGRVVEKFVMQLEAQLADRNVTIELSLGREGVARRTRLRPALRRAAAGARHPGAHQEVRSPRNCCSASSPRAAR